MPRGYDRPLYIQPFDHRGSFQTKMFGWQSPLSDAQTAEIAGAKRVIYDGFLAALARGVPKEKAGILVDEQFGAAILRDAASKNIVTACPAEKSGQDEFDFEYGEDFARHIEAFRSDLLQGAGALQSAGRSRVEQDDRRLSLKRLSDFLAASGPQSLHVRASGAGGEGAARQARRRQEGLRSRATASPDGRSHPGAPRSPASSRICGRLKGLDRREDCERDCRGGARRRPSHRSAASFSVAARTTAKSPRMARDRGGCAGLHRLCDRPHDFLGSAGRLAEQTSDARADRRRNRRGAIVSSSICSSGAEPASCRLRRASDRNIVPLWRAKPCSSE